MRAKPIVASAILERRGRASQIARRCCVAGEQRCSATAVTPRAHEIDKYEGRKKGTLRIALTMDKKVDGRALKLQRAQNARAASSAGGFLGISYIRAPKLPTFFAPEVGGPPNIAHFK